MNLASVLRGNIDVKGRSCIALLDKKLNSSIQATSTKEVEKYLTQEQLLFGRSILSNISDEVARACNSYLKRGDVSYLFRLLYFYLGKTDKDRYAALIAPKLYSSYKDGDKIKIKKLRYRRSYLRGKDKTLFESSAIKHLVTDMNYYCRTYNRRASLQKAYYEKADNGSMNVLTGIELPKKDHIGIERLQDALQLYAERGRLAIMNKVNPKYVISDARGSYIKGNIRTIHRVLTTALYEMISNTLNEEEFAQFLDHLTTYRVFLNRYLKHATLTKESMYFRFKDSYNRKEKHLLSAGIVVCNPYTSGLLTNIPKRLERCI